VLLEWPGMPQQHSNIEMLTREDGSRIELGKGGFGVVRRPKILQLLYCHVALSNHTIL
jgi:hypothetical protein